jgi:hypothetical protein
MIICPRCGRWGTHYARSVKGRRYHYVKHRENGRYSTCYLGPDKYVYAERLNMIELSGMRDPERYLRYLKRSVERVKGGEKVVEEVERLLEKIRGSTNLQKQGVGNA